MPKAKEEHPANIFEETIKVVKIAQRLEAEARKEIPDHDRLQMVQVAKESTRNEAEYEELLEEEKRLKRRLRFHTIEKVEIPQDKREIVENNYKIETAAAKEILLKRYEQLGKIAENFSHMHQLLDELILLEDQAAAAKKVESIFNGYVDKDPGAQRGLDLELRWLERFSSGHSLKRVQSLLKKAEKSVNSSVEYGKRWNQKGAK
ncbi:hypothetical protein [Planococcus rifietoensis]|uniref:hypothetical protein n=1 Tax=Planococcus rifietoensis TaxID=200991 RepID=UPI00384EDADA